MIVNICILSYMLHASVNSQTTALPDQVQLSDLKPGVYEFQLKVTDSKGLSDTAQVTVLVLTPEQSDREYLVMGN